GLLLTHLLLANFILTHSMTLEAHANKARLPKIRMTTPAPSFDCNLSKDSAKIINISESPQLVLENANVTLDCDGDYSSLKSTFSDAGWHRERVGRLNLTLLRFREGDSGVYTCEATNGVPSGRKDNKSVLVAMMQVKAITAPGPETEAENAIIVERDPSTPNDVYQQGGEVDNDFYSTLVTVGIVTVTALSLLLLLAVGFLLCRRKKAAGTKILKTNIRRDVGLTFTPDHNASHCKCALGTVNWLILLDQIPRKQHQHSQETLCQLYPAPRRGDRRISRRFPSRLVMDAPLYCHFRRHTAGY
ncbi:hypothetical protein Bbelb_320890, partial [Branchiostoma belcheri]